MQKHFLFAKSSMFGGLATVSNNSPHLRKSGSRPVVSDLGRVNLRVTVNKLLPTMK